jgi:hypothetical protein
MIVANVPHLWPLIARTFKLGSFAQNTTDNRSQFTMQNIQKGNSFNPVGSEERIAGNPQGPAYSENKLDLTGKRGFRRLMSLVVDGKTKNLIPIQPRLGL